MENLQAKKIVLGVSGSIATFKAVSLLRLLVKAGAEVAPVLTSAATRFVTPLTFSSLAGRPAITDLWTPARAGEIGHVELAHWADLVVVAPLSANSLARFAVGLADDPLSALVLATSAPLVLAPAMEENMWAHPATRQNVLTLREHGARIVTPETGELASGRVGHGRMAEPEIIAQHVAQELSAKSLSGRSILVTAGPTREHLDPVRFLSNPSTGRMGFALAAIAAQRGADVTLVTGPVVLQTPVGVQRVEVVSTEEMLRACDQVLSNSACDCWIMAAAPADLAPTHRHPHKLKKDQTPIEPKFAPTPDILKSIQARKRGVFVVGFAAETEHLKKNAQRKLESKDLDAVVANRVGLEGRGFAANDNAGVLLSRGGEEIDLPMGSKHDMASRILSWIEKRLDGQKSAPAENPGSRLNKRK